MSHGRACRRSRREVIRALALAGAGGLALPPALVPILGAAPQDPHLSIVHAADPKAATRAAVAALGGMRRFVSRGDTVLVKPNIGWARAAAQGANTTPEVVAAVVELCLEAGAKTVKVADHTLDMPDRCYARSGIKAAAERAGARVEPIDPARFRTMAIGGEAMKNWEVYADAIEVDKRINVPTAKHHSLCGMTAAMKNWFGMLGGQRDRLHRQIHTNVADMAVFFRPHLTVLDATRVLVRNGPQGGSLADLQQMDLVAASTDQVAIDAFVATLLGIAPAGVGYIAEGHARGLGEMRLDRLRVAKQSI